MQAYSNLGLKNLRLNFRQYFSVQYQALFTLNEKERTMASTLTAWTPLTVTFSKPTFILISNSDCEIKLFNKGVAQGKGEERCALFNIICVEALPAPL